MSEILRVENVSKKYGKQEVLKEVSFTLNKGEIVGLVGPNGAGKTTLMKIITGLTPKYRGEVFLDTRNIKIKEKSLTKKIGCVIEAPGFYPEISGYENLKFFSDISGVKDKSQIDEIIEELGIKDYVHKKAGKYSLGMKQRLGVAQAVLSYPPILILDEPTNGLDPAIVPKLRIFIKKIAKEKNTAVLISSHILSEIELMCDRVAFLQKGKIVKVEELSGEKKQGNKIAFKSQNGDELKCFFLKKNLECDVIDKETVHVNIEKKSMESIISEVAISGITFTSVYEVKESLEEKYLKTMEGDI